jgi:dihydrofolate reductase
MAKIVLDMSVSLDGFIAGPDDGIEHPMGVNGHRLHDWLNDGSGDPRTFQPTAGPSATVFDELMATGAVIAGRRTYDLAGFDGLSADHIELDPVRSLEAPGVMHLHYRVRAPQHHERQV